MIGGLVLPTLLLGALGWLVPRLLAHVVPEGMGPLLLLGALGAALMTGLAAALFMTLYVLGGVPLDRLPDLLEADALVHFLGLGLASALVWGPILVLSVAGLPARWTEETW